MSSKGLFWKTHKTEIGYESFCDLKDRMLKMASRWSNESVPSWTENRNELKAYGDYTGWHDSHDDSSSATCWIDFYKANQTSSEQNWRSDCKDIYGMISDMPFKRCAIIRDNSYHDTWRDHILYYLDQPYGLRGVWVLSFKKYKD
jgi:hypothetical protein